MTTSHNNKAVSVTLAQIRRMNPCERTLDRLSALPKRGNITAETARECGATFEDIMWVASELAKTDLEAKKMLRLFSADCAARVLPIYEKEGISKSPRNAIITTRRFARGFVDRHELYAAGDAARAEARAAARDAAWPAAVDAAWDAAGDAERDWQFDRLIARLSDSNLEDWPLGDENQ